MKELNKKSLQDALDTIDLGRLNYPEQIEGIVYEDGRGSYPIQNEENEFGSWLEDAEKWDNLPRESVYIQDYWSLDSDLEEALEENMGRELESPGLEGAKFATNAIQAQKEKGLAVFSTVIGFKVADPDEGFNRAQIGAPQGQYALISVPEYFEGDDWFSEIEGEESVGLIVDDDTAYLRHLRDNIRNMETSQNSFDSLFWKAFNETLDNYSDWL